MSSPPISPNPLGDAAAKEDQVGLAWRAMAAGFALATAMLSLVSYLTAWAVEASGITTKEELTPDLLQVNLAIYGGTLTVVATGFFTWYLLSPVESRFRRGGLSITTAFAGFVVAAMLTMFLHAAFGRVSLIPLGIAAAFATVYGWKATLDTSGR